LDLLAAHGIAVSASIVLASPVETRENLLTTLRGIYRNIAENKLGDVAWGALRPYPGTQVWEDAKQMGLVRDDMDWKRFEDWANFELYLGRNIPKAEFHDILTEWWLKNTLLRKATPSATANVFISNTTALSSAIVKYRELIAARVQKTGKRDLGDDLVLNFASPKFTRGWSDEGNGWGWVCKEAEVCVDGSVGDYMFVDFFVPDLLATISMLPMEIRVAVDGKTVVCKKVSSPGRFTERIPLGRSKSDRRNVFSLTISADKHFIPKKLGVNEDGRSLSLMAKVAAA
jgi:hypothetical protein